PGSCKSSKMASGLSSLMDVKARSAESARLTAWPAASSTWCASFSSAGWSSITRIFIGVFVRFGRQALEERGDLRGKFPRVDRLGDIAFAAGGDRLAVVALHREGRERDDADAPRLWIGLELARQRQPVHARQRDVHQNE